MISIRSVDEGQRELDAVPRRKGWGVLDGRGAVLLDHVVEKSSGAILEVSRVEVLCLASANKSGLVRSAHQVSPAG